MGCNLGKAVTISPMALLLSDRYCEIATAPFPGPRNDNSVAFTILTILIVPVVSACKALTERRYRRNRFVRFYRQPLRIAAVAPGAACRSPHNGVYGLTVPS